MNKLITLLTFLVFFNPLIAQDFINTGFEKSYAFLEAFQKNDTNQIIKTYPLIKKEIKNNDSLLTIIKKANLIFKQFGGIDSSDLIYKKSSFIVSSKETIVLHKFIYQFPINANKKKKPQYHIIVAYSDVKTFSKVSQFQIKKLK